MIALIRVFTTISWLKARNTFLAFLGFIFVIYWMANPELDRVESGMGRANLSPRSKVMDQWRREAASLSVRELALLKEKALSKQHPDSERIRAIYTISLSPESAARRFLRDIGQANVPPQIRATALEALRQSDKKFQMH